MPVGEDQRHVDVADQRAEAAVGETAQGVGREQPSTEGLPTGAHRVGENILTRGAPRVGLGPHRPVRAVVVAQAAKIPVHRRSRCSRSVGTAGSVLARRPHDNHSFVDLRLGPPPPSYGWNLPAADGQGCGDAALGEKPSSNDLWRTGVDCGIGEERRDGGVQARFVVQLGKDERLAGDVGERDVDTTGGGMAVGRASSRSSDARRCRARSGAPIGR
jgi:hypothetical protein